MGFGLIDKVEQNRRLEICANCKKFDLATIFGTQIKVEICKHCGCPLKTRVHFSCPLEKW